MAKIVYDKYGEEGGGELVNGIGKPQFLNRILCAAHGRRYERK